MSRKIGINEQVVEKTMNLQGRVIDAIVKRTKGEKPFAMDEVKPEMITWTIDNLSQENANALIDEFGVDAVERLFLKAAKIKNGGKSNA